MSARAAGTPLSTAAPVKAAPAKGDVATISLPAQRAAAQVVDAAKDFDVLAKEVRTTLDQQHRASRTPTPTPKLDGLSGRALAAIALNRGGSFSRTEVTAAKAALQSRERDDVTTAMRGGGTIGGLASYSRQLVSAYDHMSSEERQARGWTDRTRGAAAALLSQTDGGTRPSLSDAMG